MNDCNKHNNFKAARGLKTKYGDIAQLGRHIAIALRIKILKIFFS